MSYQSIKSFEVQVQQNGSFHSVAKNIDEMEAYKSVRELRLQGYIAKVVSFKPAPFKYNKTKNKSRVA